jgi:hypothetical protein
MKKSRRKFLTYTGESDNINIWIQINRDQEEGDQKLALAGQKEDSRSSSFSQRTPPVIPFYEEGSGKAYSRGRCSK